MSDRLNALFGVCGKVAVVTGGGRGIGEMAARALVAGGARTYLCSRDAEVCRKTAEALSESGECIAVPEDLSTFAGMRRLAGAIAARETAVHVLLNNSATSWGAAIDSFPESGWDKVMALNVKTPFFLTQQLMPLLRRAASADDPARIINIGSIDGLNASSFENFSYGPSKAALHQLTRQLARHLAREHINVNAIAPGPFATKLMAATLQRLGEDYVDSIPRGRLGNADDIAGIVLYLASRASSYVTGTVIPVDGGISGCA